MFSPQLSSSENSSQKSSNFDFLNNNNDDQNVQINYEYPINEKISQN